MREEVHQPLQSLLPLTSAKDERSLSSILCLSYREQLQGAKNATVECQDGSRLQCTVQKHVQT